MIHTIEIKYQSINQKDTKSKRYRKGIPMNILQGMASKITKQHILQNYRIDTSLMLHLEMTHLKHSQDTGLNLNSPNNLKNILKI